MTNKLHPTIVKGNNLLKCRRLMHKYPIYEHLMYRNGWNAKRFMIPASRVRCVIRTNAWRRLESHRVRRVLQQKRLIKRRLENVRLWSKLLVSLYKKMGRREEYEELELYRVAEPLKNCSSAEMPEESERAVTRSSTRKMAAASAAATIPSPVPNTRCQVSLRRLKDISNLATFSLVGKPVVIDKKPQDPEVADSNTGQARRADCSFQRQSKELETKKLKTKVSESENTMPDMAKTKIKSVKPSGSFLQDHHRQMSIDLNTISTYYSVRPHMCRRALTVPKNAYQRVNRRRVERVRQDTARQETSETEKLLWSYVMDDREEIDMQRERERGNNKTPEPDDSEESEVHSLLLRRSATESTECQLPKKRLNLQAEEQEPLETRALVQQESLETTELLQRDITDDIATYRRENDIQQEQEPLETRALVQQESLETNELLQSDITEDIATYRRETDIQQEQESLETRALVQQESLEDQELLQSDITEDNATYRREIDIQQEQEQGNTLPIIEMRDYSNFTHSNIELRYLSHNDVNELQIPELHDFDHQWLVLDFYDDFSHIFVPACGDRISVTRIHTCMQMADESQKVVKLQFFPNSPYDAFVTPSSKRKIYFGPLPLEMPLPVIQLIQMVDGKMMTREVYQTEYSIPVQLHSRSMAFVVLLVNGQVCFNFESEAKLEAAQALPEMEIPSRLSVEMPRAPLSPQELCQSQANPLDTEVADSPPCLAKDVTNDPNDVEPATTILQYLTQFAQSLPECLSDTSNSPPPKVSRPSMPLAKINQSGNVETPDEITITKLDGSTEQRKLHKNKEVKINSKRSLSESLASAIPAKSIFQKPAISKAKVGSKPQQPPVHKPSAVKAMPIPSASVIKKPAIPILKVVPSVRKPQQLPLGAVLADGKPIGADSSRFSAPPIAAGSAEASAPKKSATPMAIPPVQPPPFIAAVVAGWPNEVVLIYPPPRAGNSILKKID